MSFTGKVNKYKKKLEVYSYVADGTFEHRDKNRIKPMTRVRESEAELELEKQDSVKLKLKDWYCDIDKGYYR